MATRSTIAVYRDDGSVAKVYCHWDGYLEYNGAHLVKFYNTAEKVEALLAHGDISSLGAEIGVKHPFSAAYNIPGACDEWEQLYGNMTTYYGRDRGEENTQARVYADVAEYEVSRFEEFNYLFIDGRWYYKSYDGMVRDVENQLATILCKEEELA